MRKTSSKRPRTPVHPTHKCQNADNVNGYSALSGSYLENYGSQDLFNDFGLLVNEHLTMYNAICMGFADSTVSAARRHLDPCYLSFIHYCLPRGADRRGGYAR